MKTDNPQTFPEISVQNNSQPYFCRLVSCGAGGAGGAGGKGGSPCLCPGCLHHDCQGIYLLVAPLGCFISLNTRISLLNWHSSTQTLVSHLKQFSGKKKKKPAKTQNIFLANLYVVCSRIFVGPDPGSNSQPSVGLPNRFSKPNRPRDVESQVALPTEMPCDPGRGGQGISVSPSPITKGLLLLLTQVRPQGGAVCFPRKIEFNF